jgi:nitric oxide synthase oxygenase domain/subunit
MKHWKRYEQQPNHRERRQEYRFCWLALARKPRAVPEWQRSWGECERNANSRRERNEHRRRSGYTTGKNAGDAQTVSMTL